jgi:hypothetical protein
MMSSEPTARAMVEMIREKPDLQALIRTDLVKGLEEAQKVADREYRKDSDRFLYRSVVVVLGSTLLITLVGALALAFTGRNVPTEIIALGSAALGAMAGLLAPSPAS